MSSNVGAQFEKLLHSVVHDERSAKAIAHGMGKKYNTLNAELNPNTTGAKFAARDLPDLIEASGDVRPIHFLCAVNDMAAYKLPKGGSGEVSLKMAASVREFGEFMQAHADMDADGKHSPEEKRRARTEGYQAIGAIAAYLEALDSEK